MLRDPSVKYRPFPQVDLPNRQYYGYEMDSDELLIGYGLPWHDQQPPAPRS